MIKFFLVVSLFLLSTNITYSQPPPPNECGCTFNGCDPGRLAPCPTITYCHNLNSEQMSNLNSIGGHFESCEWVPDGTGFDISGVTCDLVATPLSATAHVNDELGECAGCTADADCNDMDTCTNDSCDTNTGTCEFTDIPDCISCTTDADCIDGMACTEDFCDNGICDNTIIGSTSVCRPAASQCDLEETCDGINPDCPEDFQAESGTFCDECNPDPFSGCECNVIGECVPDMELTDTDIVSAPTLGQWGIIAFTVLSGLIAVSFMRKRKSVST